ncbi:gamma-butyrobetaine dioxygenase [Seriola lalandi dorsalis]|uniref:gamma-butyrobetaine dioxygenase n=1 Tax=Seriola lalandi dorsalis TaxID=1841481 RepID=A0A3B4X3E6_SERLL|nr:gamma-butyrobetaine dioxygenase [Seriola lalandi dorsalis]XP_023248920.1 gamma-butyrobetaine dioxygenase [Seriola lalandi dorsalis]XP_056233764.1 gamma-butyrobetaine dioxygenase [Seriola aureovittata]XP_056233772.1 gamma-butyrobetaine dioxygenase [Seriola aureovittata]
MWRSTFARFALPALQRRTSAMACQALRACPRPGQAAGPLPSCLTSVQLRGQQTLGSASLPVASQSVRHVRALDEERLMEVEWEDGGHSLYPFTWLRDNCQCPLCTLQSAQARKLLMSDLDIHTGVDVVEVTNDNKVSIVWPDQHTSVFDAEWLKKRCFSPAARQAMQEELFLNERYYWDSKLRIPTADYQEVLHDDKAALAWLLALRRVGIVYLRGAPAEQGQVARLAERIGYLRLTFYGHTWQVQDKYMANNVAYTSGRLSHHTDYPALHFAPGVQFLHCINQAVEGGESEVVDGFHMAEQLQREDPEAFRTLTSLHVDFTDTGMDYCDFMLQSKKCIIDVDAEGRLARINYNNATRDSVLDLPLHQVQPFYRALKAFVNIMNRPENVVTYRMEPGDLVTFDNWRLLHGRRSYISRPDRLRHLEGAYLDWDEVMSRLRILRSCVHENV